MAVTPEQSAQALMERFRRQRNEEVARRDMLRSQLLTAIRHLAPSVSRLWLIGSLADGSWGERSDVDIVLDGATQAEATRLQGALEESLKRTVDLLLLDNLDAAFQARVVRDGERLDVP